MTTEIWPIPNMNFYPDSRTCYVLWCSVCGKTLQKRDFKSSEFVCFRDKIPMEVDLNGIPEKSALEVWKKMVDRACIRSMAQTTNLF